MPEKHRFDETCRYEENFTIPDFSRMLDGKVVVLTGGSYGMGKKMAEVMAEHGAKLFITARLPISLMIRRRRMLQRDG